VRPHDLVEGACSGQLGVGLMPGDREYLNMHAMSLK
jgi:hypothetical protein